MDLSEYKLRLFPIRSTWCQPKSDERKEFSKEFSVQETTLQGSGLLTKENIIFIGWMMAHVNWRKEEKKN